MNVTDQAAPVGRPVSVKLTEGNASKLAVTVPGAPTVATVEELVDDAKVIELAEDDHEEKAYPVSGVPVIESGPPELTQVLDPRAGDVFPPELAAIVT